MRVSFKNVVDAIQLAGSAAPAFRQLLDLVLPLFSAAEQDELKALYAQARAGSDAAREDLGEAVKAVGGSPN